MNKDLPHFQVGLVFLFLVGTAICFFPHTEVVDAILRSNSGCGSLYVQPSLDAILLLHIMGTASKSTMDQVPPIFNSGYDSYFSNILGCGFSSDDTRRIYS